MKMECLSCRRLQCYIGTEAEKAAAARLETEKAALPPILIGEVPNQWVL
jgi:hypothetical protein